MVLRYTLILAAIGMGFTPLLGEVPRLINYQGRLSQVGGSADDSNLTLTFRLYSESTGGESIWQEVHTVTSTDGIFNVLLGSLEPFSDSVLQQDSLFLSLSTKVDDELLPRQQLVSVVFALRADEATNVAAVTITPAAVHLSDGAGIWHASGILETAAAKVDSLIIGEMPVINSEGSWIGKGTQPGQATQSDSTLILNLGSGAAGGDVVFFGPEFRSVGFDQFFDVVGSVNLEFQLRLQLVTNFAFEVRLGYKQVSPVNIDLGPIGDISAGLSSTGKFGTTVQTYGLLKNVGSGNYRIWVEGRGESNVTAKVIRGQIIIKGLR